MRCYLFTSSCAFATIALLALFGHGTLVAGDVTEKSVINVGVYYESLCRDSIKWIRDQLVPSYDALKDHVYVDFVPYGKATHVRDGENVWRFTCQHGNAECQGNMAQSCAINAIKSVESPENVQRLSVSLVGCAMSARHPPTAVPQCAQQVGLTEETQKHINECMASSLGKELLAINGDRTDALNPLLTFVPTITINGVHSKEGQNGLLNNFLNVICDNLQGARKPTACNREN